MTRSRKPPRRPSRSEIKRYRGFTSLNFMLSDGHSLHVYWDFRENGRYYTLYMEHFGEMIIAASEPILTMKADPLPRAILTTVTSNLDVRRTEIS